MPMTRESIEAALDQPEHGKPLEDLAKARIALEAATLAYGTALGETVTQDDLNNASSGLDDMETDFIDDAALPFEETFAGEDTPAEIIREHYQDLLKRYRSTEYRMKETMKEAGL